ncbi:MAG: hypothetical protein R3F56_10310 [Planctomycetota bacterium]
MVPILAVWCGFCLEGRAQISALAGTSVSVSGAVQYQRLHGRLSIRLYENGSERILNSDIDTTMDSFDICRLPNVVCSGSQGGSRASQAGSGYSLSFSYSGMASVDIVPNTRAWSAAVLEVQHVYRNTDSSPHTVRVAGSLSRGAQVFGVAPSIWEARGRVVVSIATTGTSYSDSFLARVGSSGAQTPPDPPSRSMSLPDITIAAGDELTITVSSNATAILGPEDCRLLLGTVPGRWTAGTDALLVDPLMQQLVTLDNVPDFPIPNEVGLLGVRLYAQIYMNNALVFPDDPVQLSHGLEIEIGGDARPYGDGGSGITLWLREPPKLGGVLRLRFHIPGV